MILKVAVVLAGVTLYLSGLAVVNEVSDTRADDTRANQIAACERANVSRLILYQNTLEDGRARREVASATPEPERTALLDAADRSFQRAASLVEAMAPVARSPGSVLADCEASYD